MKMPHRFRAFTLVEMAVVLVIVGLLLSVALPLLTERIGSEKLLKGRKASSSFKQEIIGFALANGFLPTLGQTQDMGSSRDAWDNRMAYWSDPKLTGTSTSICEYKGVAAPNGLNFRQLDQSGTLRTYENVAFVIASPGVNRNLQVDYDGGPPIMVTTFPAGYDLVADATYNDIYHNELGAEYDVNAPGGREEAFDDIVEYVTYVYLLSKLDCGQAGQPQNTDVSFAENMGDFQQTKVAGTTSGGNPTIQVGDGQITLQTVEGSSNNNGCLWYTGNATSGTCGNAGLPGGDGGICDFNAGLRVYFTYQTQRGSDGGWTFTVLGVTDTDDVANNEINDRNDLTTLCGGDCGDNGYAATHLTSVGLYQPKIGIEFDYYGSDGGNYDDNTLIPSGGATTNDYNALAWLFWRDYGTTTTALTDDARHSGPGSGASPLGNPPGNPAGTSQNSYRTTDGKFVNGSWCNTGQVMWMEDGNTHPLRIDYIRNVAQNWVNATLYYNCTTAVCRDLGYDFNGTQGVDYTFSVSFNATSFPLNANLNQIRFGWTFGDCGGTYGHRTTIGEFGVTFR